MPVDAAEGYAAGLLFENVLLLQTDKGKVRMTIGTCESNTAIPSPSPRALPVALLIEHSASFSIRQSSVTRHHLQAGFWAHAC